MASNKKAQILAAVMCASSIFGSYTVVSAADTPTKIESTDKNSSVTANGSTITATAGAQGSQQSTITLGNKSLAINVGKQTTTDGITYGAFTLNSSNLAVNNSGLSVKNTKGIVVGSISNTGAITGTGLTIKNGTGTTLASLNNNGLNIYDGINTKATATITKAGAITGTGLTVKAVSDTIKPEGDYVESKVTSSGVADTIKQGGFTRATSNVAINSIKDTIYTNDGKELSSSNISKSVSDATESGSVTLIANKITTNDDATTTTLTSKLNLTGDSATLTSGSAYVKADNTTGNVLFSGNNATLSGSTFTLKDGSNNTARLTATGLSFTDASGQPIGGVSSTGAITGTSLNITAKNTAGNKTTSTVGATGVTDTVYGTDGKTQVAYSSVGTGGISNTTSLKTTTGKIDTAINQNTSGVGISSTKYDTNNNVTDKTSVSVNGGTSSITSYGNYVYGEDGKATSYNQASMSLNGNTGIVTIKGGSNSAYSTLTLNEAGVALSGKNASLSGSTFTLKDTTNGKTLASLGASGLSINNADGIKVGGISNTGNLIANDGMNVTDKNSSWVNIGTSTMQKDIVATTTTSYAGITNKIDTTLAGNKTYTSGTVVGPTSVTTTVQGSNTTDAISGNKNKTTSTVSATGVTDTVYNVKGNQVASSSVTTNGIVNTTTNLSIDGSTNNTMNTSIYQDKRGISASATKKDENGTVGTSTLTLAGNSASLKVGNYGFAVDSNNNVSIAGNNATLSGSTFTLKDANGKTATLNTSGLTLKDEDGNTTGGISSTGAITGTSLRITTSEDTNGNKTVSTVATNGVTDTVTNNKTNNKTTSQVSANGVTDTVYGTDGTTKVASSSVSTSGISNTTSLKTTTGKIDTAINQNTSGVGISSTKYDTNNNVTDKTSVSVNGGTSSITSYGSYIYGEDGKATSYNQASISLNGNTGTATIRGGSNTASSTLTLNEAGVALSGKNVGLNANGLTLYKDVDGVKTQYASLSAGGLDVKGTGSTTIKSTNATTGAIGQSQVSYNGVTDSFTKDDVTNSVTTNANGTTFSSTGNGSTTIKGDTIKTTNLIVNGKDIGGVATDVAGIDRNTENEDGLGYYTQIEGKTKIYNTGRFSTANGNFVVDPYGSITSKAGNYRFNMDRTSGFDLGYAATTSFTLDNTGVSLGFRNNSFILDKNGATFINANGENVSFTSINGGTITTGETVINGSSITTKDLYVDNIHLNGAITDGNGNVVGGGDLSLGADGTLDLKYNANGITNTFVSGATGVHSSFSNGTTTASSSVGYIDDKNTIGIKDQVGNTSVTTTTDGTTFANGSGSTTINGGNITTTGDVTVGGDLSVGDNFKVDGTTGNVTGGTYNGVQISTDKDGNAIIGGTNIGDLATNEEVNKVNDKVDAVDNKVGDTSKLDKEITDNQNYKDNQNLVGAVNAEADIRRNEISRIDGQIEQLDGRVGSLENRMSDVEDRIDKVGAMSAAIANLRTMGFDPEAPTEIAIGVGQYKSETGLALGVFHYPNQDFMLSASISTSGDEVMGGIGATWKLGRKSAAEKAKDEEARRLEKAEEMKKLAQDAKVKAQAERHAKLLTEREAQKTA
ncbi:YadA-like family protein [uncultured Megamonas sp.]|uniref:YadA-like family protein n=1 Tax=uncultured Megamonas sp. TaxID=286140 RepID=UPI002597E32C|nr:YadA-like family protein [uncultured Megamonas sp.]